MLPLIAAVVLGGALSAAASEPWTLERALSHTLTNSPDARLARQRIVAAKAALDQATAAFWPQVQVQSSYMGSDNPMLVFGSILNQEAFSPSLDFNRVPDVDNLNVKGLVTAPLYTGGQMGSRRKAARANSQATEFEAEAVRNALGFEVARAFHTIHKAHAFIEATEAATRAYESNLAIAQRRFEAGTLLRADVLDVEVRLAQARKTWCGPATRSPSPSAPCEVSSDSRRRNSPCRSMSRLSRLRMRARSARVPNWRQPGLGRTPPKRTSAPLAGGITRLLAPSGVSITTGDGGSMARGRAGPRALCCNGTSGMGS